MLAIDRDPAAIARGRDLATRYPGRLTLIEGRFGDLARLLDAHGVTSFDGAMMDVGVSSMMLDDASRGFSFQSDGPLDMRMSAGAGGGPSAADIVNDLDEADLARIIAVYGEERRARAVARAIVRAREEARIERTGDLARVVMSVLGAPRADRIHPATRTFQGLRIYLNDELGELARGLAGAETLLTEGGWLAVVAFHSLESRVVKKFFTQRTGRTGRPSRHLPDAGEGPAPSFQELFRGARKASEAEIAKNPRARSAQLRVGARTDAPAFALHFDALGLGHMPMLEEVVQ